MATAPTQDQPLVGNMTIPERAKHDIDEALKRLEPVIASTIDRAGQFETVDETNAEQAVDVAGILKGLQGKVDDAHKTVKAPYLDATRTIDGAKNATRARVDKAFLRLGPLIHTHQTKLRLAAEAEEKRRRDESEAALRAAAKASEAAAAKGEPEPEAPYVSTRKAAPARFTGAKTVSRNVSTIVIDDPYALPPAILNHAKVIEALASVVREQLRLTPDMKRRGFHVEQSTVTDIR